MELKIFTNLLRLAVYVLDEMKAQSEVTVLLIKDEVTYRIVFNKSSDDVFDFLIFDHAVNKPVLFGEGFEDSGTGHLDHEDFLIQDLLEMFYPRDDFSLN